jgi:CRISPR/Cas system CSM-associated protein Csm4 (group 5 of RAMP superfamily)
MLCFLLLSCTKKDEQIKKITQDLKETEKKLEQEKKDLENISKQKEEELKKAKDEYDKAVEENNASGKYPGKFPFTSVRELSGEDLEGLSDFDKKIRRNEILARHGFIFEDEEMKFYFTGQKWYKPKYNDVDKMLSDREKANIRTLDILEQRKNKK